MCFCSSTKSPIVQCYTTHSQYFTHKASMTNLYPQHHRHLSLIQNLCMVDTFATFPKFYLTLYFFLTLYTSLLFDLELTSSAGCCLVKGRSGVPLTVTMWHIHASFSHNRQELLHKLFVRDYHSNG